MGGLGGRLKREGMCVCMCVYSYNLLMMSYGRNQHNIIKQLSSNFQKKKKSEMVHSHETSFSLGCLFKKKKKTDAENKCW